MGFISNWLGWSGPPELFLWTVIIICRIVAVSIMDVIPIGFLPEMSCEVKLKEKCGTKVSGYSRWEVKVKFILILKSIMGGDFQAQVLIV